MKIFTLRYLQKQKSCCNIWIIKVDWDMDFYISLDIFIWLDRIRQVLPKYGHPKKYFDPLLNRKPESNQTD